MARLPPMSLSSTATHHAWSLPPVGRRDSSSRRASRPCWRGGGPRSSADRGPAWRLAMSRADRRRTADPMRIAYFADTFRIGGAERFLADVVAGAAGAGHDAIVVSHQASVLDLVAREAPAATPLRLRTEVWTRTSRPVQMGAFAL